MLCRDRGEPGLITASSNASTDSGLSGSSSATACSQPQSPQLSASRLRISEQQADEVVGLIAAPNEEAVSITAKLPPKTAIDAESDRSATPRASPVAADVQDFSFSLPQTLLLAEAPAVHPESGDWRSTLPCWWHVPTALKLVTVEHCCHFGKK